MKYDEIIERARKITEQDVIRLPEKVKAEVLKEYHEKFKKSKILFDQMKEVIPGGLEHNLNIKEPFPLAIDKVDGAFMWDVDGNKFTDFLACGGPIILGHNFPEVRDFTLDLIREKGPASGITSEYELLSIKEIQKHMPSIEMFRWYGSGTEADMAAARVARVFTGKQKIIKVGGSYHGWSDQFVFDMHVPGTANAEAYGIPKECLENTLSFKPNDTRRLEKLITMNEKEGKGGVAAVFLEPLGGESGTHPVREDFNKEVREICDKHGVLLIFDEVVTGFRIDMGGAQKYFGVKPDLTVLGKIIGHGYPAAGGLGGRKDIMRCLAGGVEGTADGGKGMKRVAYTGGTLSANALTCAAAWKALQCMEKYDALNKASRAADKITNGINDIFERHGLPFFVYNYKSIFNIQTTSFMAVSLNRADSLEQIDLRRKIHADYSMIYALEGIITLSSGSRAYTTMPHDNNEIITNVLAGFDNFCNRFKGK
nr:aminotransferase class III-fold pyridoxal phosphate-dependent enzyme [Candidatus Sigynarchaeota archaeon]